MKEKKCVIVNWSELERLFFTHFPNTYECIKKAHAERFEGDCVLWLSFTNLNDVPKEWIEKWDIVDEVEEIKEAYEGECFRIYFPHYKDHLTALFGFNIGLHYTDEEQVVFIEE